MTSKTLRDMAATIISVSGGRCRVIKSQDKVALIVDVNAVMTEAEALEHIKAMRTLVLGVIRTQDFVDQITLPKVNGYTFGRITFEHMRHTSTIGWSCDFRVK